jgi:XTP/dITP diphosphohydrolase
MDRLRAPGGCAWDAQQTHASLVKHLLEEAYEAAEAIERGDRADLREELGDVLLQVVFHASNASQDPADPFDLDDLAEAVADKLVRRHPQIFAADQPQDLPAEESYRRWDQIKAAEKARASVLDGIPAAQSPLARAQKVFARARRAGLGLAFEVEGDRAASCVGDVPMDDAARLGRGSALGERLAALAAEADAAGVDAEAELRGVIRRVEDNIRDLEASGAGPGAAAASLR